MKKTILVATSAFLLSLASPIASKADTQPSVSIEKQSKMEDKAKAGVLILRLDEINKMDISSLNSRQKNELLGEVESIETKLNNLGGGVYFSLSAVIIILVLLIILL